MKSPFDDDLTNPKLSANTKLCAMRDTRKIGNLVGKSPVIGHGLRATLDADS